jgi:hypothetical protein
MLILTACGKGSSSSGGPAQPLPPVAKVGNYDGIAKVQITSPNNGSNDFETGISFQVDGFAQNQRVFLAYREFSGSSNLDLQFRFSIPSGTLRLEWFPGVFCTGGVTYFGQFVGSTVSGTLDGIFQCPTGDSVTYNGTFSAQFVGAGKILPVEHPMLLD